MSKSQQIDLGLALLRAVAEPGQPLTCEDIAAWCDCSSRYISAVESTALTKLRSKLRKAGVDPSTLAALVPDETSEARRTEPVGGCD